MDGLRRSNSVGTSCSFGVKTVHAQVFPRAEGPFLFSLVASSRVRCGSRTAVPADEAAARHRKFGSNGARVTKADIVTTNGIVHAIDAVILPKNWQLLAAAA